jgi:hypothetical protein
MGLRTSSFYFVGLGERCQGELAEADYNILAAAYPPLAAWYWDAVVAGYCIRPASSPALEFLNQRKRSYFYYVVVGHSLSLEAFGVSAAGAMGLGNET